MPHFARASKVLITLALLWGCAAQEGIIDRPDWAQKPTDWSYSGLTVASYGRSDYKLSTQENTRMAEEDAMRNARQVIAQQIAKAYLKASKSDMSEADAARRVEAELGNLIERQSKYDEQRGVYFIQLFVPASRVEDIVKRAFGTSLKVQSNGELG